MPEALKAYEAAPYSYPEARTLAEELGLSDPVAVTLVRRGYRTPDEARAFLEADETHRPDEFELMGSVVGRIRAAIEAGEQITVHGDFDVDGVCATTVMVSTLRELGAECDWLIPDRLTDGYGLSAANVERLGQRGTSLIVTVDCGITAVEEVRLAQQLGMAIVVTDHHQPAEELPDCQILHPALSGYPFTELCGTAVAWKLACALREASSTCDLDLVALATVADVVPLIGENRSLVRRGLEVMRRGERVGLRALMSASKVEPTQLDESDLGFKLGPRINAAGRLYRADAGVELFLTEDEARASEIAIELNRANGERRRTEREVDGAAEAARRELPDDLREARGLVLAGHDWHPGVIGIVASRLVERHYRPVVMISLDGDGGGRGSGRSIPGFDLLAALEACSEHLVSYGGHRAAAGLQLRAEDLDAFRAAFAAHANEALAPDDLRRTERIDAMVGGAGLGLELAEELGRLAPFGMGNPGVRLLVPSARVSDVRTMGEGKHSRFSLHSGSHKALGVAFGRSRLGVGDDDPVDVAVRLEVNHWNGSVEPRVVLRELFPRGVEGAAEDPAAGEAWWRRFEAELEVDPTAASAVPGGEDGHARRVVSSTHSPAAVLGELVAGGGSVLALSADTAARAPLERPGMTLADYSELERNPGLGRGFAHLVVVDPAPFAHLERLIGRAAVPGGYLHPVWGEPERRFALSVLASECAQREEVATVFRGLREAGETSGEELRSALAGAAALPRRPEVAARCFRVLSELDLVQGTPNGGGGTVGVVSSEGTDLERSPAFRAYGARFKEGKQYLEGRKHP
ncbi:MAG TPA: single-stranded-DNA-specific exonuclease RecJ [Solirubrobacterales bacterium]